MILMAEGIKGGRGEGNGHQLSIRFDQKIWEDLKKYKFEKKYDNYSSIVREALSRLFEADNSFRRSDKSSFEEPERSEKSDEKKPPSNQEMTTREGSGDEMKEFMKELTQEFKSLKKDVEETKKIKNELDDLKREVKNKETIETTESSPKEIEGKEVGTKIDKKAEEKKTEIEEPGISEPEDSTITEKTAKEGRVEEEIETIEEETTVIEEKTPSYEEIKELTLDDIGEMDYEEVVNHYEASGDIPMKFIDIIDGMTSRTFRKIGGGRGKASDEKKKYTLYALEYITKDGEIKIFTKSKTVDDIFDGNDYTWESKVLTMLKVLDAKTKDDEEHIIIRPQERGSGEWVYTPNWKYKEEVPYKDYTRLPDEVLDFFGKDEEWFKNVGKDVISGENDEYGALRCLVYLQKEKEVEKDDFERDVYCRYNKLTPDSWWDKARNYLVAFRKLGYVIPGKKGSPEFTWIYDEEEREEVKQDFLEER